MLHAFVEGDWNAKAVSGFKWKQLGIRYPFRVRSFDQCTYRITTSPDV